MVRQLILFTVLIAFMLASCIDTIAPDPPDDDPRTDPDVGLSASYFDSISAERVLTRIDPSPSFFWPRTGPEPVGRTPPDLFSASLNCRIRASNRGVPVLPILKDFPAAAVHLEDKASRVHPLHHGEEVLEYLRVLLTGKAGIGDEELPGEPFGPGVVVERPVFTSPYMGHRQGQ